ncbi:hypothetical protein AGMMS50249_2480 [candidate division SR1 bacterium]|nr:hypothetical protein AGMMS50249_2480 [candidate division SR1 bacterium]
MSKHKKTHKSKNKKTHKSKNRDLRAMIAETKVKKEIKKEYHWLMVFTILEALLAAILLIGLEAISTTACKVIIGAMVGDAILIGVSMIDKHH